MAVHTASVVVDAPADQVYGLFSHFNDFPKFMSAIKEVTYYDDTRSHWVADILGRHEWDAVNEDWIPDEQIGWRSTSGFDNSGRVAFESLGPNQTQVTVEITYDPPAGALGDAAESLGAGRHFQDQLGQDLARFAEMVRQAPPGSLDPNSSSYLFHSESAASTGTTTSDQERTMGNFSDVNEDDVVNDAGIERPANIL